MCSNTRLDQRHRHGFLRVEHTIYYFYPVPAIQNLLSPSPRHGYGGGVDLTERVALVALFLHRRSGWGVLTDEIELRGSAADLLAEDVSDAQPSLLAIPGRPDRAEAALTEAADAIRGWTDAGLHLVTVLDDEYPAQLRTIHQRPPFLFYRGTLRVEDADGVAVVGTRKPSERGIHQATEVAAGLAERCVTVVSGLAAGIDTASHQAAIRAGGRTVGVVGTGLEQHYPRDNAQLQDYIAREHLVISQFWPGAAPTKKSFPMRNAVMSGYAAATVVIEANHRSGARMQARLALEHGRPVLLLDTLLEHDWARDYAGRPGTHVVRNSDEVLERLDDILTPTGPLILA